jgi:hypothetical protein
MSVDGFLVSSLDNEGDKLRPYHSGLTGALTITPFPSS